jgi:hypothetical protein
MTLPHGFGEEGHTSPRETCTKCNPPRKKKVVNPSLFHKILLSIGVIKRNA